jgi:ketosteroid isomerase-like protein
MKPAAMVVLFALFSYVISGQTADEKFVLQEKEVLKAEQAWLDASRNFDAEGFQRILREDYVGVDADGRVRNKIDWIKAAEESASHSKSANTTKPSLNAIRVRLYADVAVVTGGMNEGRTKATAVRFAHVWVKTSDQWQLSTSHATRVAPGKP